MIFVQAQQRHFNLFILTGLILVGFFIFAPLAHASTFSIGPSTGTFTVGSTFDASVYLNTEGKSVNAIEVSMSFPADKLQLISPSTGKSIIGIWTAAPQFNNQTGRIELQGGVPGGINVSSGLVTTLTFRVKSVGSARLGFLDNSRVLLNDGFGTDDLRNTISGVYQLTLPPPSGPIVSSRAHSNQSAWYSNPNVLLEWIAEDGSEGYSYVLNREPVDNPDNISEGSKTSVTYKDLSDGVHYFHIKSLRNGAWGGVTHFAIQIDTTPPADFPVEIIPSTRTTRRQPVVQFESTDKSSGIDHYELKLVSLTSKELKDQPLFIEAKSPYVLALLDFGKYDVIVRAYDKAGNYQEITKRLAIVNSSLKFIESDGFEIRNVIFVPWTTFWTLSILILLSLWYGAKRVKLWHRFIDVRGNQKKLPKEIERQLEELRKYKSKYGSGTFLLLLVFTASLLLVVQPVMAEQIELTPPLITTLSRNISNEEIFYAGGKTDIPQAKVVLYLQNLQDGQTRSYEVVSDKNGDWFYRHDSFLSSGKYLLWTQSKIEEQLSPPSPQAQMTIRTTAIQFGSSRFSYEAMYLIAIVILLLLALGLIIYIVFHFYHGRKKYKHFMKEVKEAEESLRRGFAVLKRDIEAEFAVIKKAKLSKEFSEEEKLKEDQLLRDLQNVERYIGKEIWDIEKANQ